MTMIGQNGNANLDKILLIDSSSKIDSLKNNESEYEKIITFDLYSHDLLSSLKIQHEISDEYLNTSELSDIQQKTYHLSKWSKQTEIASLIEYDGINLGNLLHNDFIDFIAIFLKKLYEITKIVQVYQNHEFVASSGLFGIVNILTTNVQLSDAKETPRKPETVKYGYRLGQKTLLLSISKEKYIKLKNISESFLQKIFRFDKPKNKDQCILLIEFDPTKYNTFLSAAKKSSQNILLYNRRWPTIWNLESFNVIRKSGCRVATHNALFDNTLQIKINEAKIAVEKKLHDVWNVDFFKSFFTIDNLSFWSALKPFFEEKLTQRMMEAIHEIELAKKLFAKYKIKSILILSEIGFNEQIVLHLAKRLGIRVVMMQHGLPYETVEASERNNLLGLFPNFSDAMIVWGNMTKKYLEDSGINPLKLQPLGNPAYDTLFHKKKNMHEETILLATSPPMKDLVSDNLIKTNQTYRSAIKKICEIASSLNQKLVIKLHPSLVDFDVNSLTSEIDDKITVITSGSIFPLIENCKILITFDLSTTILEAQILKKPVISINLKDYGFGMSQVFKMQSCITVDMEDFEQTLKRILSDYSFRDEIVKNGNGFVDEYLVGKGSSSNDILNFLSRF